MSETLDIWRPDRAVFLRRTVILAIATIVFILLFSLLSGFALLGAVNSLWQLPLIVCALALVYFAFNDYILWRSVRSERWELTTTALIHHGSEGQRQLALSDVTDVKTRFGWTVIVTQKNGQSVEMSYVRQPAQIAKRILHTRDTLVP